MNHASDLIAQLLAEHRKLLAVVESLEQCIARPIPTIDDLAAKRWVFTRDMLLHFAKVQKLVLEPLTLDRRACASQKAMRSSDDLVSVFEQFQRHAARWKGLPPTDQWGDYIAAIKLLMRRFRVRLAAQESEIYPLLPVQPGGIRRLPISPRVDFAAEAWKVRGVIYDQHDRAKLTA